MKKEPEARLRKPPRKALCALAAVVLLVSGGCELLLLGGAAGAGAGATSYYLGKLEKTVPHRVPATHKAAVKALRGLGLELSQNRSDRVSAHLESEFADGKPVWVDIDAAGELGSTITIRVGWMGDKARAQRILNEIQKRLGDGQSSLRPGAGRGA